jgi:hypothetical protein
MSNETLLFFILVLFIGLGFGLNKIWNMVEDTHNTVEVIWRTLCDMNDLAENRHNPDMEADLEEEG